MSAHTSGDKDINSNPINKQERLQFSRLVEYRGRRGKIHSALPHCHV